jgi:HK97 family phage portal protein
LPALYSCTRLLAESLASLPLKIYTSPPGSDVTTRYTGPSIFDHPSANSDVTLYDWLFQAMTALLLHGNAWGLISGRDGYGYPTGIEWLPPDMVQVEDDARQPWNPLRTRVYVYGRLVGNWRDELFHVKAYALPGRTEGISPLRAFALTVLSGMEAGKYGTDWFAAGGFPSGVFRNQELEVSLEDAREVRESLMEAIRGHKPLVIGRDWDYKPVAVPPSEAQFLEALQANATQLAAIFGLPPDRVGGRRGDSLTYNCLSSDTDILSLRGWLRYDQVTTDDTCLTLNTETGLAEWQPVTSVHVFKDGPYPVTRMESKSHSSVSTLSHRWPVLPYGKTAWEWTDTARMGSHHRVASAAPVATPSEPKWSDALVELVAWFWTEGWVGKSGAVTITQSDVVNPGSVTRIRAALTELFGPSAKDRGVSLLGGKGREKRALIRAELARNPDRSDREIARACLADGHTVALIRRGKVDEPGWQEDRDERRTVHFRLNAQAGALLLEHAPGKVVTTSFLSQLTRAQLELFYQTSIDADGCRVAGGGRGAGARSRGDVIAQRDRARLEAFQVACALTGRAGTIRQNNRGMWVMCLRKSALVKPKGHPEYITQDVTDLVWCVQTPNKTWFARRNGTCYFSGNTVEQSTLQVIEALRPWLVRLETAFFRLLPQNRFCRFNADALLKTDLKTRTEIYAQQRSIGMLTIDEIRDLEDRAPYPNSTGDEKIPLDVMVAMSRSIRGIPKSMLPSIDLEVDLIADRLTKLESQGLTKPEAGPSVPGPEDFLSAQVGSVRSMDELEDALASALQKVRERKAAKGAPKAPEFVGPWIPSEADLARLAGAGGNGNGRH